MSIIRSEWILENHAQSWCFSLRIYENVSECDQSIAGMTNALVEMLHLLITDVSDGVRVDDVAPISDSDHSSLMTVIFMAQAVPNFVFK